MSDSPSEGANEPRDKTMNMEGSGGESREANVAAAVTKARPTVHIEALNSTPPKPVSPNDDETNIEELNQEISEITELDKNVDKLEEELDKYKTTDRTPMVANPESPSAEEKEGHELTHANHKKLV